MNNVAEITKKLEEGIQSLFESDNYKNYLNTLSKFHNYSPGNAMLIFMQRPDATYVAGYNAWKDKFSRQVQKGEKGIKIIAPMPFKHKDTAADGTEVDVSGIRFKVTTVFDVSQTKGEPLPQLGISQLPDDLISQEVADQYKRLFSALEATSPVPVGFENITSGAKGYYSQAEKRIAIHNANSFPQQIKTLVHEITHARLHDLDKNAPENEPRPDRRTREVEAESIAYTVCSHYGLDTSEYSFAYIAGWSSGKDMKELKSSLQTIQKGAAAIINDSKAYLVELEKEINPVLPGLPSPTKNLTPSPEPNPTKNPAQNPAQHPTENPAQHLTQNPMQNPIQTIGTNPNYRKLSQEEINSAANTNLIDFLQHIGEPLKQSGNSWRWTGSNNESCTIIPHNPHMFKHFSTGESGNAITFCQSKLHMTFQEAVEALNTYNGYGYAAASPTNTVPLTNAAPTTEQQPKKMPFLMPKAAADQSCAYNYLNQERGLQASRGDIVDYFMRRGDIYQTNEGRYQNIAFVYKDFDGNLAGAIKRGFPPNDFKGNHSGSNIADYCFRYEPQQAVTSSTGEVYIFESPIDMISYIAMTSQIDPDCWRSSHYLATGGVHPSAALNYIRHMVDTGKPINTICLCQDNDAAGMDGRLNIIKGLEKMGYTGEIRCHYPQNKDWNMDLMGGIISEDAEWNKSYTYDLTEAISNRKASFEALKQSLEAPNQPLKTPEVPSLPEVPKTPKNNLRMVM
jgi:antirestriction protein ArdC